MTRYTANGSIHPYHVIRTLSIFVNTSLFAIFTNQHLQNLESSQNQTAIGVTPDPFFRHHKEKRKKAVWPRETSG